MAVGPPGVPHAWSNPSDSKDLCIVSEHTPALHMEYMLEGGFTIARDLQADKRGALKHLLRMAVLLDEARDDFYMTQVPMQALAWIIHEPSVEVHSIRRRSDERPEKVTNRAQCGSERPKSGSPYSSTKLAPVNNPG